jgi:hypothetical protein
MLLLVIGHLNIGHSVSPMLGPELTHWTIRLALLCLVARLGVALRWGNDPRWFPVSRTIWTIGFVLFAAHVACAFHFYHDWSHTRAFDSTAEQTGEMLGIRFGEGIYFSYLFMLLWLADVTWQWAAPISYQQRPTWLAIGLLAYMAFIAFNGAVIFEGGVTRYAGIPITAVLSIATFLLLLRQRPSFPKQPLPSDLTSDF